VGDDVGDDIVGDVVGDPVGHDVGEGVGVEDRVGDDVGDDIVGDVVGDVVEMGSSMQGGHPEQLLTWQRSVHGLRHGQSLSAQKGSHSVLSPASNEARPKGYICFNLSSAALAAFSNFKAHLQVRSLIWIPLMPRLCAGLRWPCSTRLHVLRSLSSATSETAFEAKAIMRNAHATERRQGISIATSN
jgi:hypothetical protein